MKTISKEYLLLFNTISDVEETLRQLQESLVAAQRRMTHRNPRENCCNSPGQRGKNVVS